MAPSMMAAPTSLGSYSGTAVDDDDFSFHDLLSIVNPLQHFPVVSTIYRTVTGDTIKPFERVAGDTLYGGVWGFVSSVANIAFQQITGKDFGDTALALLEGNDDTADIATNGAPAHTSIASLSTMSGSVVASGVAATPAVASVAVAASATVAPAAASGPPAQLQRKQGPSTNSAAAAALVASMGNKGIDPALSQRALSAYQKSLAIAPTGQPTPTS